MIARASRIVPVWFVAACLISIQHGESSVAAFATPSQYPTRRMGLHMSEAAASESSQQSSVSSLFEEFRTSWGEVVSPYETLRLSRNAENQDIKKAYYKLMKKYHPDKVAQRDILPGSCNDIYEVKQQYERIKLSYEILINPKLRTRYNRAEAISDPKGTMARAAMSFVGWGLYGVGKGIEGAGKSVFKLGEMAATPINTGGMKMRKQKTASKFSNK